jgi:uncharacterized phage protein (TIGR02220 family)
MNYIKLVEKFWIADLEKPLTPSDTRLYFYLVHTCNKLAWKVPFGQSDRFLSSILLLSINCIRESKNRLKQRGLIEFKAPEKGSRSFDGQTKYSFPTVSFSDTVSDTVSDTNNKLNKTKQNKTILTLDKSSDVGLPDFQAVNQNVQTEINFNAENQFVSFIKKFNEIRKSKFQAKNKSIKDHFVARIKEGYTVENMIDALKAAMKDKFHIDSAFKYLTPEFFTRGDKIEKYLNQPQTADSGKDDGEWSKKMLENLKKNKS